MFNGADRASRFCPFPVNDLPEKREFVHRKSLRKIPEAV
jgi:hypothetical protein